MEKLAVILPAAGTSSRFGGQRNKLEESIGGEIVLRRSILAFINRADVAEVIVAVSNVDAARELIGDERVKICLGGANRAESVRAAIAHVSNGVSWIAIHDAARPLVSHALIDRVFAAAKEHGAAAPALPVALTIKHAHGPLPAKVVRTAPRDELWAMQTPQVVAKAALVEAFAKCAIPLAQVTDDLQLLEMIGRGAYLVAGEERNLKITTRADLVLAEHFLREGQTPMTALFLILTAMNLLCLGVAAVAGYAVGGHDLFGIHPPAGMHLLSGVLAAFVCCAVHCVVFTYFIATAKWVQHAIVVKHLDLASAAPTRSFRAQAFPAAILGMIIVFITAFSGAAVDNYALPKWTHHALAITSVLTNAVVALVEYRAILRNGRLIDSILEAIRVATAAA